VSGLKIKFLLEILKESYPLRVSVILNQFSKFQKSAQLRFAHIRKCPTTDAHVGYVMTVILLFLKYKMNKKTPIDNLGF